MTQPYPSNENAQPNSLRWTLWGSGLLTLLSLLLMFIRLWMCSDDACNAITAERSQMNTLRSAVIQYKTLNRSLPTTEQGLAALVTPPPEARVKRKLVENSAILDPWGHPYQYRTLETPKGLTFEIWSLGGDGLDGTEDDVRDGSATR